MSKSEDIKSEIDKMSYYDLLKKFRFANSGDPILRNEYFIDTMSYKRFQERNPNEISKMVGWDKNKTL